MKMPFTEQQFLEVFKNYNMAIWPLQLLFYLLAFITIFLALKKTTASSKIMAGILSFFWLWMGIAYHFSFFTAINKAAYLFGSLFIIQGVLFLIIGVLRKRISFEFTTDIYGISGAVLIVYALIAYPLLSYFQGHLYPYSPTFGLPCPTTIFTLGVLQFTKQKTPMLVLVIPFLWSMIGTAAAFSLGIQEDTGLGIAGLIVVVMAIIKNKSILNRERTPALTP